MLLGIGIASLIKSIRRPEHYFKVSLSQTLALLLPFKLGRSSHKDISLAGYLFYWRETQLGR